jgi:hypothetical protein
VVDAKGKGGGLALYWDNSIKLNILSYDMHHIDTLIWDGDHHAAWRGIFVYREPQSSRPSQYVGIAEKIKTLPICSVDGDQ